MLTGVFPVETTYKILLRTATQQGETGENHLNLTIVGANGQTKKLPLNDSTKTNKKAKIKKEETIEFDVKGNDVGRVSSIVDEDFHEGTSSLSTSDHQNYLGERRG